MNVSVRLCHAVSIKTCVLLSTPLCKHRLGELAAALTGSIDLLHGRKEQIISIKHTVHMVEIRAHL